MPKNKSLMEEIWAFLKVRKAWWMTPMIVLFVLAGLLIIFGQSGSILSPIIYALF